MGSQISDQTIINNVLGGDTTQFNELVLRHKDYAYTLALSIVHNPMDAEEIAHDAFMKAYKSLAAFNRQAKFTTWLYRIVFNTAVSHLRKNNRPTTAIDELTEQPVDSSFSDDGLAAREREKYIALGLNKLQPQDATLITLFYQQQLSLEEIGAVTGLQTANVKVKLFRARKRLARTLTDILQHEVQAIL